MSSAGVFPADVVNVSCVLRPQVLDLSRPVTGMVQLGGFEPPTSGSTDRRSNHLSYSCTALGRRYLLPPSERLETRSKPRSWQGRSKAPKSRGPTQKSPGQSDPGSHFTRTTASLSRPS